VRLKCALRIDLLPTFEINPSAEGIPLDDEDRPNAPRAALISYGLWASRFGK